MNEVFLPNSLTMYEEVQDKYRVLSLETENLNGV